ncbi:hypothetical protein [Acidocella sp.]|uniref:hypothetical protein n=1 Tax=Acidocella sp. TaxID=50710 RepID=UPI002632A869|nr:hypothetical protein [Acidocella sp.]MDD2795771.1 hypothetical protein [Acidocella sp.]
MERQSDKAEHRRGQPAPPLSLEVIAARLAALDAGQAAMNGALGLMLDTMHVQTTLLRKLNEFAADDAAPSPLLTTLQGLTAAIMELDASVGDVERKFDGLAQVLRMAFGVPPGEAPPDHNGPEWPQSPGMDGEGG